MSGSLFGVLGLLADRASVFLLFSPSKRVCSYTQFANAEFEL